MLWQMHGYAAEVMRVLGLQEVKVSISHADEVAVAQVSPANPPPPPSPCCDRNALACYGGDGLMTLTVGGCGQA